MAEIYKPSHQLSTHRSTVISKEEGPHKELEWPWDRWTKTRSALTFTDDGRFVIACVNSVLAIWRVSDRQLMRSWPCEASLYRDLPDILFTVSRHNIVASFEARKGEALDLYPFSLQWDALEN